MVERIIALVREKGLTPSQFADEIGIQRSGMSHLISGRNKPSLEFIMKVVARYPEVSLEWLILGKQKNDFIQEEDPKAKIVLEPLSIPEQRSIFDEIGTEEVAPKVKSERKREVAEVVEKEKATEKIIILYNDCSFREYNPA